MESSPVEEVLAQRVLDLRKLSQASAVSGSSLRFMDQKITVDILPVIARVILEFAGASSFSTTDVRQSPVLDREMVRTFGKPSVAEMRAKKEYDKIAAQPLKALSYAGVLEERKTGAKLRFSISSREALEYIARGEREAFVFLCNYLIKVLVDSGLAPTFETFRSSSHTTADYHELRDQFTRYINTYTAIKKTYEPRRILPKILNVLAVYWGTPGTAGGRSGKVPAYFATLRYNNVNARDKTKAKNVTRQQAALAKQPDAADAPSMVKRAMDDVRERHFPQSEVAGPLRDGAAIQVHHIVPRSQAPELSAVRENLVLLTASQHSILAHPMNNTSRVDPMYQLDCLAAKSVSVEESLAKADDFYDSKRYLSLVSRVIGVDLDPSTSMEDARAAIAVHRSRGA